MKKHTLASWIAGSAFVLAACSSTPTAQPVATISVNADGSVSAPKAVAAAGKPVFIEFYSVT
jgi:starvation-inducible outer membrane lipoprotein